MNYPDSGTVTIPGKKTGFSFAARALVVGLALVLPGAAALATIDPIPGIDIVVRKNPGGIAVTLPSDASGKFSLRLKEPGNYTISTACRQPSCASHTITATYGYIDYKCVRFGICFNITVGQSGGILSGQIKLAENESPRPTNRGITVAPGDVNGDGVEARKAAPKKASADRYSVDFDARTAGRITGVAVDPSDPSKTGHAPKPVSPGTGPHRSLKAGEPTPDRSASQAKEANDVLMQVSTTRGTAPKLDGADEKPGISDQGAVGGLISYGTAPPPKDGAEKLPGQVSIAIEPASASRTANPSKGGDVKPGAVWEVINANPDNKSGIVQNAGTFVTGGATQATGVATAEIANDKTPTLAVPGKGADIFDRWGNSSISGSSGGFGSGAGPGMSPGAGPGAMGAGPGAAMGGR